MAEAVGVMVVWVTPSGVVSEAEVEPEVDSGDLGEEQGAKADGGLGERGVGVGGDAEDVEVGAGEGGLRVGLVEVGGVGEAEVEGLAAEGRGGGRGTLGGGGKGKQSEGEDESGVVLHAGQRSTSDGRWRFPDCAAGVAW